jgi:hypothetical protein
LATAEVILEQNVDPGWFVCPLAPTLKRGGMRGGGRYHNSVKTGIFKNSVIYTDTDLYLTGESFTNMSKPAWVVLDQTLASPHLHAFHAFHMYYGCFWSHYPDSDVTSMCKHAI